MTEILTLHPSPPADLTIAVMTNAPYEIIARFTSAQAALGVDQIFLYIDNPKRDDLDQISSLPHVNCVALNASFFGKKRPNHVEGRQLRCYKHALQNANTRWLGICDIDEFFVAPIPLYDYLQTIPNTVDVIRARSLEAVWHLGANAEIPFSANYARKQLPADSPLPDRIYGAFASLQRNGIYSHIAGKYIVRLSDRIGRLKLHGLEGRDLCKHESNIHLLHFDAINRETWIEKMRARITGDAIVKGMGAARKEQLQIAETLFTSGDSDLLFENMYCLSNEQVKLLNEAAALYQIEAPMLSAQKN